jgi:hypothetical protein
MTGTAYAGSGGQLRIEKAWYSGHEIAFLPPSLFSANPNGGVLACFGLGLDTSGISRPTQSLYVIFDNTATQDHCDGQPNVLRHDHVLPVAPGDRGYTGAWTLNLLVEATPGSIDLATHPITTAAQVHTGLAAGTLIDVTSTLAHRRAGQDGRTGDRRQLTAYLPRRGPRLSRARAASVRCPESRRQPVGLLNGQIRRARP